MTSSEVVASWSEVDLNATDLVHSYPSSSRDREAEEEGGANLIVALARWLGFEAEEERSSESSEGATSTSGAKGVISLTKSWTKMTTKTTMAMTILTLLVLDHFLCLQPQPQFWPR